MTFPIHVLKQFNLFKQLENAKVVQNEGENNPNMPNLANLVQPKPSISNQQIPKPIILPETVKMDAEIVQKYLQSILEMPQSLGEFVEQIKSPTSYQFLKIFVENLLSTKALAQLLNQNSKEAVQKLLNAITSTLKQGGSDISQLKEILSLVKSIQNSTTTQNNALRELLLIYIPIDWQVFNKEGNFDALIQENNEDISSAQMSILFETINFSNVLITLNEDKNEVLLNIFSNKDFPKQKFEKIVSTLANEIAVKVTCDFKQIKQEKQTNQQSFRIISNDYVSTQGLLVSHVAIKSVFNLDNH